MEQYGLHGKLTAKSGLRADLAQILLNASKILLAGDSCHLYLVSLDEHDENAIWVTEAWDSKEDHDQSLQDPKIRSLIAKGMEFISGPPEKGLQLKVIGGMRE